MFAPSLYLLSALALASAAPLQPDKRAGPSGFVVRPAGGYSAPVDQWLMFEYQPVFYQDYPGAYATSYVNLGGYIPETGQTYPIANGLASYYESFDAASGIIDAMFNLWQTPICGNLQLVVTEYQVGNNAPSSGFQSAAPYITLSCATSNFPTVNATVAGTALAPKNGDTLGTMGTTFQVLWQPSTEYGILTIGIDVDIQDASADPADGSSYTLVARHLTSQGNTQNISAWFQPSAFGTGEKRIRFTEYTLESPDPEFGVATEYVEVTIA